MLLWRGGLAFAGAAWLYYGVWQYLRMMAWPAPVKIGAALAVVGLLLVSLILERRKDAQTEGSLSDD